MKLLNTIEELWNDCAFCPICQKSCRDIFLSVGPDNAFKLSSFFKFENLLEIRNKFTTQFKLKQITYKVDFLINCNDNSLELSIEQISLEPNASAGVDKPYFYFYLQGICKNCKTSTYSSDLEFDLLNKKITNIGIERESIWLSLEENNYYISNFYDRNITKISQYLVEGNEAIELPIINFDFSDLNKVNSKIKTLILFS